MKTVWIVLLMLPSLLFAQQPEQLTLRQCIDRALQNSYALQAVRSDLDAAKSYAAVAKTREIPKILGELAGESRFLKPYTFGQAWAMIHADWSLGDFLLKTGAVALQQAETVRWQEEQAKLNITGRVSGLYAALVANAKQKEILNSRLQLIQKHYLLAYSMWKSGLKTQLDVLQTRTLFENLQQDSVRLEAEEQAYAAELARLIDYPDSLLIRVKPFVPSGLPNIPEKENDTAVNSHPLLQVYASQIKEYKLGEEAVKARHYPHLFAGGGRFYDGDPTGDGSYWQLNAGLAVPIYYGRETKHQVEIYKAKAGSATARMAEAKRTLKIGLDKIRNRLEKSAAIIKMQQQQLVTIKQMVDFSEINYKAGLITNLEFLTAQEQFTKTALTLEKTRLDFLINLIDYYLITNQTEKIVAVVSGGVFGKSK